MSGKIFLARTENDEYVELSTVSAVDVVCAEDLEEDAERYIHASGSMEFTATATIDKDSEKAFWKAVIPKGYRNAKVLKRDGYLSTENMEY